MIKRMLQIGLTCESETKNYLSTCIIIRNLGREDLYQSFTHNIISRYKTTGPVQDKLVPSWSNEMVD